MPRRLLTFAVLMCTVLFLGACGTPSPTKATATPTLFAKPTPTPTPSPGRRALTVSATGVGVYQLVTVPVATVHNDSNLLGALGVQAHFTPMRGGEALNEVSSPTVAIPPGATIALTANCTDTCAGATSTRVRLTVTSWGDSNRAPVITATKVSSHRGNGGPGAGYGSVSATLNSVSVASGTPISTFAECRSGSAIVGGGYSQDAWNAAAVPQAASVSTIISRSFTTCTVYSVVGS